MVVIFKNGPSSIDITIGTDLSRRILLIFLSKLSLGFSTLITTHDILSNNFNNSFFISIFSIASVVSVTRSLILFVGGFVFILDLIILIIVVVSSVGMLTLF